MIRRRLRADMIDRSDSADMTEPSDAAEPTENADRAEPMEPIEKIEPTEPIERIDPLHPMHRIEASDLIDHSDRPREGCSDMRPAWPISSSVSRQGRRTVQTAVKRYRLASTTS